MSSRRYTADAFAKCVMAIGGGGGFNAEDIDDKTYASIIREAVGGKKVGKRATLDRAAMEEWAQVKPEYAQLLATLGVKMQDYQALGSDAFSYDSLTRRRLGDVVDESTSPPLVNAAQAAIVAWDGQTPSRAQCPASRASTQASTSDGQARSSHHLLAPSDARSAADQAMMMAMPPRGFVAPSVNKALLPTKVALLPTIATATASLPTTLLPAKTLLATMSAPLPTTTTPTARALLFTTTLLATTPMATATTASQTIHSSTQSQPKDRRSY